VWKVGDRRSGPSSKRILREFCRRRLPATILERPKRGFPVPAYGWIAGSLGDWAAAMLGPSCRLASHLDARTWAPVLVAARAGDMSAAHKVWVLLVLEHWLQAWP
jgi:asparagine synthase (glutamine-hydrolysing)